MLIYAHRAGRGLAPENTLYACQKVLRLGVDFIDFDVGMTKDGHLVATHDMTLNCDLTRNAEGQFITDPLPIYSLTYAELSSFNVGQINPHSKYTTYFPEQEQLAIAKIPLLREVIEWVLTHESSSTGFQFEIKTDPRKPQCTATPYTFAQTLSRLIQEFNIADRCEVQSFDYRSLFFLQTLYPAIKTTYLTRPKFRMGSFLKRIKALGGCCWGPFQMDVEEWHIKEAKNLGIKCVPWGYPEKEGCEFNTMQITKLISWGVDGIITDRPDLLKNLP